MKTEKIVFRSKREQQDFDFINNNVYFEEKDVKRNGFNKILIDLSHLSKKEFDEVKNLVKDNNHFITNDKMQKVCIL